MLTLEAINAILDYLISPVKFVRFSEPPGSMFDPDIPAVLVECKDAGGRIHKKWFAVDDGRFLEEIV